MRVRLTLPQLDAFLKLAELATFREAALALGISQPALSRTIQLVEARLGTRLFDRDSRSVTLTPAGEKLRPLAQQLIRNYDASFAELDAFIQGQEGCVRVGTLPSVAVSMLPSIIFSHRQRYPGVRVEVWEEVSTPIHRMVSEGEIDLGLASPSQAVGDLNYRHLLSDELVLVCRADDPLAKKSEYTWDVFTQHPFIGMSSESAMRSMIDNAFLQAGLAINQLYNCRQSATVIGLIIAGLGISALPRLTLTQIPPEMLALRPLKSPTVARSIGIIRPANRSLSPAALAFQREIETKVRRLRAKAK